MSTLRVRAYTPTFVQVSRRQLEAIGHGIRASGDDFEFTNNLGDPADAALVVSAPKYPGSRLFEARDSIHRRFAGRTITCESPLFRRGAQPHEGPDPYSRLSVGGFMRDDAQFHPRGFEPTADRWHRLEEEQGLEIKPWRYSGKGTNVLLCLQKPSDASLRGMSVHDWTIETVKKIEDLTFRPIVLRPHPLDKTRAGIKIRSMDCTWSSNKNLEDDLQDAFAVVTYTSLSAIESVMDGLPTFCMDPGNHAWPVSLKHKLDRLSLKCPMTDGMLRGSWLWSLAWSQWKLSELREGTPWRRLRSLLT